MFVTKQSLDIAQSAITGNYCARERKYLYDQIKTTIKRIPNKCYSMSMQDLRAYYNSISSI